MATVTLRVEETRKATYEITIPVSNEDAENWGTGLIDDEEIKDKYEDAIEEAVSKYDGGYEAFDKWEDVIDCDYDEEDE